jgi:hypothetical protein
MESHSHCSGEGVFGDPEPSMPRAEIVSLPSRTRWARTSNPHYAAVAVAFGEVRLLRWSGRARMYPRSAGTDPSAT